MSQWDPWFSDAELTCHCGCGEQKMDPEFMEELVKLRGQLGFPLPVTSGYRCPKHNNAVSFTGKDGPHTQGRAVDIHLYAERLEALLMLLYSLPPWSTQHGIGLMQHGSFAERFVHVDLAKTFVRPRTFTYAD